MGPQEFIAPPDLICCVCALSRRPFAGKATSMELRRNNQNCSQLARECRTARHASAREVRRILEVTNLTYRRILHRGGVDNHVFIFNLPLAIS